MSTLTHTDVAEVDLTLLGRTAADWNQTASHLKRLAGQARSGLLTKSEHARWDGVNATVTRDFIRKTTKEFTDACTQATTVARILEDAHQELTKIQTAVRHIRDVEAPRLGINLVGLPGMPEPSHNVRQPAVTELNQRLKVLVAHAAEIDASVARALRMSHGDDAHNFGHRTYASLDAAQTERALELARIGPMLSNAQFTELNSILAFNAKDSDFSTAFYQGLGSPKKALEFYARMSLDCTVGDQPERLALAKDLQRAMGTALASATDPDNRAHLPASWAKEFRTLGTQPIPTPALGIDRPYGYQILGGLLRYGEYDPRFINPLAEDILRIHKEDPDFFMETKPTRSHDPDFGFNPSGLSGAGYDPLTSVLEGLGHSPEAAKQFFKDDRHFDDLTRADFPWAPDTLDRSSEDTHEGGPDALGHALEAATTGHPWDDTRPGLHRDAETTAIMRKVVALYSPTSKVEPQDALMDSLGRMGAAYIDDLNYSTLDFGGGGDDLDRDQLFRTDKTRHGGFGEFEARNFMNVVASDEEGYKILSAAQQMYTSSALASFEDDRGSGMAFAHNAAKVHGILDQSRISQVELDFKDSEEQANLNEEKKGEWRKYTVESAAAAVAGVGSALILGPAAGVAVAVAVPLAMDTAAGAVGTAYGNHTLQYLKDNEVKNDAEALKSMQEIERACETEVLRPVSRYGDALGMTREEKAVLYQNLEKSHALGRSKVQSARQVA
ncbi:hypothetical protein GCM10010329_69740 [Streptomyces spiroverticillatus]|uniref:AG2 protein n=1 Tax=Streptomyces finlayi TaxID=67296 RepID=A0A919CC35_9ACTN|nr:hypothetical protein [Streptomyces finlayi]GHA36634.1 hypothetical protein GCM10010329_69740 [Streptomyces spiroverticillatus]GHD01887.1 hypothetical protein GCM10010334_48050 [Streptomyces finlayi]